MVHNSTFYDFEIKQGAYKSTHFRNKDPEYVGCNQNWSEYLICPGTSTIQPGIYRNELVR